MAKPLMQARGTVQGAQFSPDGRWMAYASNETGGMEIYVSPFLNGNGKWQVSTKGGLEPRWRQDGKELFYLSPDGKVMAVPVKTGARFVSDSPVALFQTHRRQPISSQDVFSCDVSAHGRRFLIAAKLDEANAAPLAVLLNWSSELRKYELRVNYLRPHDPAPQLSKEVPNDSGPVVDAPCWITHCRCLSSGSPTGGASDCQTKCSEPRKG